MPAEIMSRDVTQNSRKGNFIPIKNGEMGYTKFQKKEISALIV